ncbi:MAG: zinc ribbon domain-containing protein [Planctomycetota bacterium]
MPDRFSCSHCGADLPAKATFCKHCGSSDQDGWQEEDESLAADDDFDYDSFIEDEFGTGAGSNSLSPRAKLVILILLAAFALSMLVAF